MATTAAARQLIARSTGSGDRLAAASGIALAFAVLLVAFYVSWALLLTGTPAKPLLTLEVEHSEAPDRASTASDIGRFFDARRETPTGSTRDLNKPIWLRFSLDPLQHGTHVTVEVRTLRFESGRFWVRSSETGFNQFAPAPAKNSTSGFSFQLSLTNGPVEFVAEVKSFESGFPKVLVWKPKDFSATEAAFERQGGALFGSLLVLAAFSAVIAFLNRDATFLLFAGWLITSLRVAAINGGWDKYWLGLELSDSAYLLAMRASIAAHGVFTVALVRSLLLSGRPPGLVTKYFRLLQISFLVFFVASPWVAHLTFLRTFWMLGAVGLASLTIFLGYTLVARRTTTAIWYSMSWFAMILGTLSEIAVQSGVAQVPYWFNSQTAAIVSAVIMGLALADRLRSERDARLAAQARSVKYLKKFEENYNSMPVGLFSLDRRGNVSLFNPTFAQMFSMRTAELSAEEHVTIDQLLGQSTFKRLREAAVSETTNSGTELQYQGTDGRNRWFLTRVSSNDDSIEGSIQEITSRKEAEARLLHLVDHDHLTGALNRRGLDASLQEAIGAIAQGETCAVAYVDVDRFKVINDLHGHGTGDALLQQMAARLRSAIRVRDRLSRIADSFVVVFFDCPDNAVSGLSERLREIVSDRAFEIDGKGLHMTVSVGVVRIEAAMSPSAAMAAADRACSEAKARGRNCVVRLTDQDTTLRRHLEELKVVADLQERGMNGRYFLEFQPIIPLKTPFSSLNYEVLIRMRAEDGSVIPPAKFIGAAERNGLMSQIDRWVLRNILEWLDNHPQHRDRLSFATINLSGASLNDTRFIDDAFSMIAEHPLAMPKLCFEITESVALEDVGSTRRFVDRVRLYGSKVALDDFGAGYTSFNYLKEIPADFIKIDGSFVRDINRNPANYAITRTIVDLTHELGMRSIAEWAETPDTIASLLTLGVDFGQGYGLVRPISPDTVAAASSGGALITDQIVIDLLTARSSALNAEKLARQHLRRIG